MGEFETTQVKPGHPKNIRTGWHMAAHDVGDAKPANAEGLGAARELHSQLMADASSSAAPATSALTLNRNAVGSKRKKQSNDNRCSVKPKWTTEQMSQGVNSMFWNGKYKQLQLECRDHGVAQDGTLKTKHDSLRAHYAEPHVDATRKARTQSVTIFFAPSPTAKVAKKP